MRCLNDKLIQKYIDGEATPTEIAFIKGHISGCTKCAEKIKAQKKLADNIKSTIRLLGEKKTDIPDFQLPPLQNKKAAVKFKKYIYAVSAACLLTIIFFITQKQNRDEEKEIIYLFNFESEFDANLPVSKQELIINVINPDGKITEYHSQ